MTEPTQQIEALLKEALSAESERAMTMTDPSKELRRFQDVIQGRSSRRSWAILAVTATAAAAVTAVLVATHVVNQNDASPPTGINTPAPSSVTSVHTSGSSSTTLLSVASPSSLPASAQVTRLDIGPGVLGVDAFGAVWGIADNANARLGDRGMVFRVAQDGTRVLSKTAYKGLVPDGGSAFRVGNAILVPTTNGYAIFSPTGRASGQIKLANPPENAMGVGDASGAWVLGSRTDTLVHIAGRSHKIIGSVNLPLTDISSLALGGGSVWAVDNRLRQIYKLDEKTGSVLLKADLPGQPVMITWGPHGVYESDTNYIVRRLDPKTLKVTASTLGDDQGSWFVSSVAPDGTLWGETAQGTIAQLDPVTLETRRSIQLFDTLRSGGAYGTVITKNRAFKADGDHGVLYSFPLG